MKSIVKRLHRTGSANSNRSNASNTKFVWKQTPDGKRFKIDNSLQAADAEVNENPLYTPGDIPNSFVCGVCSAAMHFRAQHEVDEHFRCSICNQECFYDRCRVQLMCDNCELYVCCSGTKKYYHVGEHKWKSSPSCYESYYDQVDEVRQVLYNRQKQVSELSKHDQQHWLRCLWHDIVQNMDKFRAELHHASQVEAIDSTNVSLVVENLGMEVTKSLVRLFVIFHRKLDSDIVEWFSSLIQHQRELFGVVALQTCVKLKGRLEQLKWHVQELSLNVSNSNFSEAFETAARMGKLDMLEYFLEDAGVDPTADDNAALQSACRNGHLNVVDRLLQDDRVNPSYDENAAIRKACVYDNVEVVERLLQDDRVDPSSIDNYAIRMACEYDRLNVVERLLQDNRVDPSARDNCAIQMASENGHLNVVERLLQDDRVDPSAKNNYAIRRASRFGHLNVVERLLQDDRVDPSAYDNFAILKACEHYQVEVMERLLQDDRVDPSAENNQAIRFACLYGYLNIVERLLQDERVDPSADDNYAIRYASQCGQLNVVEPLLQDERVDPSALYNEANRLTSHNSHVKVVERLLQDDRVDPTAQGCEAIREANNANIIKCLYDRTRNIVCYMIDDDELMKKITHLHHESLVMGGLCLSHVESADTCMKTLPQDVVFVILLEWASLSFEEVCNN